MATNPGHFDIDGVRYIPGPNGTATPDTAGSPLLLAERLNPSAEKTVLVYLQTDGQPVDPAAWEQPNPFEPTLKEGISTGQWGKK